MDKINPKKILLVEDDDFLAKMLSKSLESHGYQPILAGSGREGMEKIKSSGVDMILLDIMLPDMDGFDVLKKINADVSASKLPVIILSNLGQPEDIYQGKNLGARDYLVKSDYSLDEIVKRVSKYLPN
ncbi:MAG: response regulator [Patescibacteria group bacterium]|nr:response regulator [Patescibacteria group bacterium]